MPPPGGGSLSAPLRSRFGIFFHLDYYGAASLQRIVVRSAGLMGLSIDKGGAQEIACRCRGTPRIANRLLRQVRDFAQVESAPMIVQELARVALDKMGIDRAGLDRVDQRILEALIRKFDGRPDGIATLAAAVHEDAARSRGRASGQQAPQRGDPAGVLLGPGRLPPRAIVGQWTPPIHWDQRPR